jgi:alginate O-acetyltransferase complex protein AlgI
MLFNSFNFLIFFPLVTAAFFLMPRRFKWALLLAASCFFYMNFIPYYILILGFTIIVDYFAGILLEGAKSKKKKKIYLVVSIMANIGVLFFFKYFNFFNQNLTELASFLHWNYSLKSLSIILPIGLSFHTFQSLSYTIEVYYGRYKAEKHFGIFALYVMFYPQLVAGPIERPQNLLHQFREAHPFDWERIKSGLQLMLFGFFKKLFIADNLAVFVNQAYNHPSEYSGLSFIIATLFFTFQIYCDFSGYSDIAIGSAKVMGFKLMDNFRQPYFSRSISEFWKRWHISLSTWFRDYVYIPLGGNRVKKTRLYFNLLATFFLSGFWHGANWTFVIWGMLNGFYLVTGIVTAKARNKIFSALKNDHWKELRTFLAYISTFMLVAFSWIFFRAENLTAAKNIIVKILFSFKELPDALHNPNFLTKQVFMGYSSYDFYWALASIFILLIVELAYIQRVHEHPSIASNPKIRFAFNWVLVSTAILLILVFAKTESQQFIYFQF